MKLLGTKFYIPTRSVFKCFNVNILDYYFITYKSAFVGV